MGQYSPRKMRIDQAIITHPCAKAHNSQVAAASNILRSAQSLRAQAEYFDLPMVDYLLGLVVLEAEDIVGETPRAKHGTNRS